VGKSAKGAVSRLTLLCTWDENSSKSLTSGTIYVSRKAAIACKRAWCFRMCPSMVLRCYLLEEGCYPTLHPSRVFPDLPERSPD